MFLGRQCYYLSLTYGMHVSSLINHFPYHVLAQVWHNPSFPLSRLVLFGHMEENLHPTDLPNSTGTYLYMPVSELVRIALNSRDHHLLDGEVKGYIVLLPSFHFCQDISLMVSK